MSEQMTLQVTPEEKNGLMPEQTQKQQIPEQFLKEGKPDFDALYKAHSELLQKQTQQKPEEKPDAKAGEEQKATEEKPKEKPEEKQKSDLPPAFDKYVKEFSEKQEISEASLAELEAKGISRTMVDQYIAGARYQAETYERDVMSAAGGAEGYKAMTSWLSENASEQEIEAFNTAVTSNNAAQAKLAVSGMMARYQQVEGKPAKLIGGKPTGSSESGFQSWAQVTAAMSDPRYKADPAYRTDVERRIALSNI